MLPSTITRRRSTKTSMRISQPECVKVSRRSWDSRFIRSSLLIWNNAIRLRSASRIGLFTLAWVTSTFSRSESPCQRKLNITLERSSMRWRLSPHMIGRPISTCEFWQRRNLRWMWFLRTYQARHLSKVLISYSCSETSTSMSRTTTTTSIQTCSSRLLKIPSKLRPSLSTNYWPPSRLTVSVSSAPSSIRSTSSWSRNFRFSASSSSMTSSTAICWGSRDCSPRTRTSRMVNTPMNARRNSVKTSRSSVLLANQTRPSWTSSDNWSQPSGMLWVLSAWYWMHALRTTQTWSNSFLK